ncbi:hypothetical protein E4U53_000121 [Claviceps sorghi]|nr:hypothetical protein E4U53_000121 [Claviceps sorghi]
MAARAGEENVATLFADVHYFYGSAAMNPRHHRFDKGSYVYLFENAAQRRCRIEVANHPGTGEQDAFDGHDIEWHLPSYDLKNETKYRYKLHSLDIYFWTFEDALQFVNGVRRVLPTRQVKISDEPVLQSGMNSVIQRLEDVDFSNPQYRMDSSSVEAASHHLPNTTASVASESLPIFLPPPPPPPATQPTKFIPMAYNPAAPAAPEPIEHREKTPPVDEDPLNPLAVAVAYDYEKRPFTPTLSHKSQVSLGVTSPQPPANGNSGSLISPHFPAAQKQQGLNRVDTRSLNASLASPRISASFGSGASLGPRTFSLPLSHPPTAQLASFSQPLAQFPQQVPTNSAPVTHTGRAESYLNNHPNLRQHSSPDYTVHQQFYRPSESELIGNKVPQHQVRTGPRGKMEENASRLEKGVTGMLKKFEKKFG